MVTRSVAAGFFKQTCLALLDQVAEKHIELVITKRGRPVAKLVPIQGDEEREAEVLSELRGKGRTLVDEETFLSPTGELAGWSADVLGRR